ncbi:hypothetical protein ACHHYP_20032 [Achlya hypogyna]|uniref:Secreted protein n=1 Tax=Achlya hypogyna TaxID=1202772 RepID=A0A1V9ZAA9_ACHHY|nr:hypothetical protein ACHHYP_20032 [Achlya hypogyna]
MRRTFLAIVATTAVSIAHASVLGPCSPGSAAFCLVSPDASIVVNATGNALDLSSRDLARVEGLPLTPVSINLAQNAITAVHAPDASGLSYLNLSSNLLQGDSLLSLPTNITTLDLSFNAFTTLDNSTFNWLQLPKLQTLLLRGNGLTRLQGNHFPPSLTFLDLSDNPLAFISMDQTAFNILSSGSVTVLVDSPLVGSAITTQTCFGVIASLRNATNVCIEDANAEAQSAEQYMMRFLVVCSTGTFLIVMLLLYRKYRMIYMTAEDIENLRATCTSSVLYEDTPTQFVELPTPDEKSRAEP